MERSEKQQERIAVFAGVFDPVHNGHIAAAEAALAYGAREVLYVPERVPIHKHGRTSYEQRMKMLQLALAGQSCMRAVEYPHKDHYIAPFFTWLNEVHPAHDGYAWLVGSDVVGLISEWPDAEKLAAFNVKNILYLEREDSRQLTVPNAVYGVPVTKIQVPSQRNNEQYAAINSTKIREQIRELQGQLHSDVAEYIRERRLYGL